MKTILVWVLVTSARVGGYSDDHVTYSMPLATKEDCMRLAQSSPVKEANKVHCVQVSIPVQH